MRLLGTFLLVCAVVTASSCGDRGEVSEVTTAPPSSAAPPNAGATEWSTFRVDIDTQLVIDLDEHDWPPLPVDTGRYLATVIEGRDKDGEFTEWRLALQRPAVMEDGSAINEVWVSARHVGWELALLADDGFGETIFAIVEGGGTWRAELWRADRAVDPILSDPYTPDA